MLNEMNGSGSSRDKMVATPKQDKWKDPFYNEARGFRASHRRLFSHKVDSIRQSISGTNELGTNKKGFGSFLRSIWNSARTLFSGRKGIA